MFRGIKREGVKKKSPKDTKPVFSLVPSKVLRDFYPPIPDLLSLLFCCLDIQEGVLNPSGALRSQEIVEIPNVSQVPLPWGGNDGASRVSYQGKRCLAEQAL